MAAAEEQQNKCLPIKEVEVCQYEEIPFDVACNQYKQFDHVAHCMIYALDDRSFWDNEIQTVADVMIRFDGTLGFGGGRIDAPDASIVEGLNRELKEEINLDLDAHKATQRDHVVTHLCIEKERVTHFYSLQVTIAQYLEIEKRTLLAQEWGRETLGILRVPLYTMRDKLRGLPYFLAGRFIGNARQQLLTALERRKIMSADDLRCAVTRSKAIAMACAN